MIAVVVAGARLAQFLCAVILFGAPLFFLYGLPAEGAGSAKTQGWPRPLLRNTAAALLASILVFLLGQTAVMADSAAAAFSLDDLATVLTDGRFGLAIVARAVLTALVIAMSLALRPSRGLWRTVAGLAALILASFAWTGHGGAGEGALGLLHLGADVLHLLAAGVWLGALAVLSILLFRARHAGAEAELDALHRSLQRFSGMGAAVVAILLATGLVNSWFLVGPTHLADLVRTPYGLLLLAKVGLFAVMLGLAAANRYLLTPRLRDALRVQAPAGTAVTALGRSVIAETSMALGVLALVSVLGTLAPPALQ